MRIRVECYSGGRADERPRAVTVGDRRHEVADVLDTWYGEDHLYFKLRLAGGDEVIVRRDAEGEWTLQSFRADREA